MSVAKAVRLYAHFLIPCRNAYLEGRAGPNTPRTLEGVAYSYPTETPDGFPCEAEFLLFARLAPERQRRFTTTLWLSLYWHGDPAGETVLWTRRLGDTTFRPDVPVRDVCWRVMATYEFPGWYEFRLKQERPGPLLTIGTAYLHFRG